MGDVVPIHLILMGSTKKTVESDKYLKYVFDLKGSMVNRETKEPKNGRKLKPTTVLKDLNVIKKKKTEQFLKFGEKDQEKILKTLERDSKFLRSYRIMDYSLLFAVEYD